jgi:hypothetical protein
MHVASGAVEPDELRSLGQLLSAHVRLEERELFEHLQQVVPADELASLTR